MNNVATFSDFSERRQAKDFDDEFTIKTKNYDEAFQAALQFSRQGKKIPESIIRKAIGLQTANNGLQEDVSMFENMSRYITYRQIFLEKVQSYS